MRALRGGSTGSSNWGQWADTASVLKAEPMGCVKGPELGCEATAKGFYSEMGVIVRRADLGKKDTRLFLVI